MIYPDNFEQKVGFTAVRERLLSLCVSSLGVDYCREMQFSSDFEEVVGRLRATNEMVAVIQGHEGLDIDGIADCRASLRAIRVDGTFMPAADLLNLRKSIEIMETVHAFFAQDGGEDGESSQYPELALITSDLLPLPHVVRLIDRIIDRFGNVKDNASPALSQIRADISRAMGSINSTMRRIMARALESGLIDADTAPSVRDGRLVIPVAPMHKRKINGIVHDESASGKTVYIEPAEIVETNNRIRELQMDERREITRILIEMAAMLRPEIETMMVNYEVIGRLDFILAKARFAILTDAHMPSFSPSPELEWYRACHPVLLLSLHQQGKEIVPLDITLNAENRILVISGPNAGGKSVTLKTVGIVQYMAQCGMLPPLYENSHMGIFEDVFIDIGDDQSIENDLSTYSSHLRNMKNLLNSGRNASLMLIDEFGAGTEPQIGGAIAQALLARFNNKGMWGVVTTHFQNLKHFAENTPGLANGSMLYDRGRMEPLFRLSIGNPGSSFAVEIARKIGLPAEVIEEASEIVGSEYINMDKYLLDIARDRRYWENKRMSIRQKEKKIEQVMAQYEADAETLRQKRREIIEDAKVQAQRIIDGSNTVVERTILDIRKAQAERERTLEARKRLKEEKLQLERNEDRAIEHPLLKKAPKAKPKQAVKPTENFSFKPGDTVRLDGQTTVGKVLEVSGQNAVVSFGMLKTSVKVDRLRHTMAKVDTGAGKASFVTSATTDRIRSGQLNFKQEIDVRGMRVDEAVQAVTYFIDDAIQYSVQRVRILHGTGTGALRQYIRQYLDTVRGVMSYRDEHVQFGGAGITVVELG